MEKYIDNLKWRYATKLFDNTRKVSQEDLEKLLDSIRLSASSYGLQPYEIIVVEDSEIREKLKPAAWNQSQISDASHLIVFAAHTGLEEDYIQTYLENISNTRKIPTGSLSGLKSMLENSVLSWSKTQQAEWAAKQAYIALGNFLSAAASFQIDTCPMEGFDAAKFDEILDLSSKGLTATVIAPIGYRSEEDKTQFAPKVRKSNEQLFHFI